ncbi:hypothetical protein J1605_017015 [Eschrichtius robustus]|uniref:Uncharacterized protein n=1 Tax=Eschrichtius robustus TaxID=9764 RepID=A0AB34HZJ4_ESCRO|nr:hypothetical protein J1605_017015 [Eschrichtius robustus]
MAPWPTWTPQGRPSQKGLQTPGRNIELSWRVEFFQSPSTYSDLHDSCPTRETHPQPHSKDLGQLSCTLEPLGEFKTYWYLDPTPRDSDVIGLECGLCISRSSPAGAEVQPQLESVDPDPVPEPRHLFHSSPAQTLQLLELCSAQRRHLVNSHCMNERTSMSCTGVEHDLCGPVSTDCKFSSRNVERHTKKERHLRTVRQDR